MEQIDFIGSSAKLSSSPLTLFVHLYSVVYMKYITEPQTKQRNWKDGRLRFTKMIIMAILILLLALPLAAETADGQQEVITDQQLLNFGIALVEV